MPLRKHGEGPGDLRSAKQRRKFLCLERATIAEWQGASEGQKFAAKPTPAETDSSDYFGIKHWMVTVLKSPLLMALKD